ncbi:hypothetical protein IC607_03325 [Cellulomonas sp. JH27-2]|uniref:hypothetical protein n=1 Tax=Cellulomonas sp. JH27-2 TaxID=2774139 RepID=UPI001786CF04|nr:hypothetical protein [Cellulomonas sp. JH27-2]MBD8057996.1 hypothetical protein [Cellulomonas sp. JH27-2]
MFDELALLSRSPHPTWQVEVVAPAPGDSEELVDHARDAHLAAEDWTRSIRMLCPACSQGRPDDHDHHTARDEPWDENRVFGAAGAAEQLLDVLIAWAADAPGRSYSPLEQVL